ncbi:MAG: ABC transporter permease [Proteobacteria bacterium]|nr:ABC transporter permease [Pseudomonadota bacterium]
MRPLDRKLLRDLVRLWPQAAAIALLAAIGVAVAVMAYGALKAIGVAEDRFYRQTRFADVFASAERAPLSLVPRIREIPGVAVVDARATGGGLADVPGQVRPAIVRIIGLPDEPAQGLNALVVQGGRLPDPSRPDEAVALKSFLDAAKVRLGDRLTATVNGRQITLTIVGAVLSPEYVYAPGSLSTLPDDAHQAVLWTSRATAERSAGLVGAFSDISIALVPGAPAKAVTERLTALLEPYGGTVAYGREDQISHAFLTAELKELRTSASVLPPIFLVVAAVLTHLVMSRLVATEREQIGLLKAFGFTDLEVAVPYVEMAAVIGLAGALAGGVLGAVLSVMMTRLYAEYFRFPVFTPEFNVTVFAITAVIAMGASVAGSLVSVRRVAALRPAVALQPAPPTAYRRGPLDRLGIARVLDQPTRMILRRLERFPVKTGLTIAGLAASLALLVGTQFLHDSLNQVIDHAYYRAQRWSAQIGFFHPREARSALEAARLPGVAAAEPVRVTAAWARGPTGLAKKVPVMGLEPGAQLAHPLDRKGRVIPFEGGGVVLSEALGRRIGVKAGQSVELEFLEGQRGRFLLPVTALADDYSGLNVFMARAVLNRLLREGDLASGADLVTAADQSGPFYRALEARPQVISAASRDDTVQLWRRTMARTFSISIVFYLGFAGAIAFGVAYNMGRITLAERSRDLATLQVLGFTRAECAYILFGELALAGLIAAPVGLLGGQAFAHGLVAAYSREELRLPILITARTLGLSLTAYAAAIVLAALLLVRRLWSLDLVSVLKTRE